MVVFAGPPFVRLTDSSNNCSVPLIDMINVMIIVGFRSGTVIFQKVFQPYFAMVVSGLQGNHAESVRGVYCTGAPFLAETVSNILVWNDGVCSGKAC